MAAPSDRLQLLCSCCTKHKYAERHPSFARSKSVWRILEQPYALQLHLHAI